MEALKHILDKIACWITCLVSLMVYAGFCCILFLLILCKICSAQDYTSPRPDTSSGMMPPQKTFSLIQSTNKYVPRTNWLEKVSWTASLSTNVSGYQVGYFTNFNFRLVWFLGQTTNLYWNFQATNPPGVLVLPAVRAINTNGYVSQWLI